MGFAENAPISNPPILLGTGNPAKQDTLRWLLEGLPLRPVTPQELGLSGAPDESGETHEEIARQKAAAWSQAAGGMLAIATDGGLVIPVLGERWESRYTHRFAGPAADDAERARRLQELLKPHYGPERAASFVEALAIASGGKPTQSWSVAGSWGVIAEEPSPVAATLGFWVFAWWCFPALGKYHNQLTEGEKASLGDHWLRLRDLVQSYFKTIFATEILRHSENS